MTETDPEGERITSISELKAEQDRQGSLIDEILGLLKGGKKTEPDGSGQPDNRTTTADPPPADVGEQTRQAVRDVMAERDQATKKEPPKPEVTPREAGQPGRDRLARAIFGKERK